MSELVEAEAGAVTRGAGERAKREPSDRRRGPALQGEPLPGSAVQQRPSSTKLYWALTMWLKGSISWYVFFSPKQGKNEGTQRNFWSDAPVIGLDYGDRVTWERGSKTRPVFS